MAATASLVVPPTNLEANRPLSPNWEIVASRALAYGKIGHCSLTCIAEAHGEPEKAETRVSCKAADEKPDMSELLTHSCGKKNGEMKGWNKEGLAAHAAKHIVCEVDDNRQDE